MFSICRFIQKVYLREKKNTMRMRRNVQVGDFVDIGVEQAH